MKKSDVFPSKYLKADALSKGGGQYGTMILTVTAIDTSEPFDDGNTQRVLHFKEDQRTLGLNATNWDTICAITGKDDDEDWVGACLELYVDPRVRFGNKTVPAIRVREPQCGVWANSKPAAALNKVTAWDAWKKADNSDKPADSFKAAVEDVERQTGKKRDGFGNDEWKIVLGYAKSGAVEITNDDIPFSPIGDDCARRGGWGA